jgi:hypothetical protein
MTRVGLQVDPVAPIRFERYKPACDAITPAHPARLHKKLGVGLGSRSLLFVAVVFVVLTVKQPLRPVKSIRGLAEIVAV